MRLTWTERSALNPYICAGWLSDPRPWPMDDGTSYWPVSISFWFLSTPFIQLISIWSYIKERADTFAFCAELRTSLTVCAPRILNLWCAMVAGSWRTVRFWRLMRSVILYFIKTPSNMHGWIYHAKEFHHWVNDFLCSRCPFGRFRTKWSAIEIPVEISCERVSSDCAYHVQVKVCESAQKVSTNLMQRANIVLPTRMNVVQ